MKGLKRIGRLGRFHRVGRDDSLLYGWNELLLRLQEEGILLYVGGTES